MSNKLVTLSGTAGGLASIAAALGSFCCAGPIALAALGAFGVTASTFLSPYRFYLLAGSLVFLAIGFWRSYRKVICEDGTCAPRANRFTRVVLWASAIIWVSSAGLLAAGRAPALANPEAKSSLHITLDRSASKLREAFNADAGKTRLMMLVAPT